MPSCLLIASASGRAPFWSASGDSAKGPGKTEVEIEAPLYPGGILRLRRTLGRIYEQIVIERLEFGCKLGEGGVTAGENRVEQGLVSRGSFAMVRASWQRARCEGSAADLDQ